MLRSIRNSPIALVFGLLACAASGQLLAATTSDQPQDGPEMQQWYAPPTWSRSAPARAEGQHRISTQIETIAAPLYYTFTPISPCRQYNSLNATPLLQGVNRTVTLVGAPCGIPTTAVAVSANITVFNITGAAGNGVFKIDIVSPPTIAWINYPPTETQRGNAGTVALNGSGQIIVQVAQGAGQIDFVVDINGYYSATDLVAFVNADGTLARSLHGTGVSHTASSGVYIVSFDRDITGCYWLGNVGLPGTSGTSGAGYLTTVRSVIDPTGVFVDTFNGSAALTDLPFVLHVICGP